MDDLTISDVRARTGLAASALRFYERKGLVRARRGPGRARRYDGDIVEQVALIDLMKAAGFTLGEIASLVGPTGRVGAQWRDVVTAKLDELEERARTIELAQRALRHTLACERDQLDDCPRHHRFLRTHAATLAARASVQASPGDSRGSGIGSLDSFDVSPDLS